MNSALTETMDVAQVVLYLFWAFFFSLIFWLRREDRREGYPLENDTTGQLNAINPVFIPPPKSFLLQGGHVVTVPNFKRDTRPINGTRTSVVNGSTMVPNGNPLLSGVGPASYVEREDKPDTTYDGHVLIVPMRTTTGFAVNAGPNPIGFKVVAADGKVAGVVTDLWIDRADYLVRYFEIELASGGSRLLPITMLLLRGDTKTVDVASILSSQFADIPTTKNPEVVTVLEEERICAYYAGGRLFAEPSRAEPLL
jgi:photosynthetic reaction center H subunit